MRIAKNPYPNPFWLQVVGILEDRSDREHRTAMTKEEGTVVEEFKDNEFTTL